jgi:hypothetical protein
MVAASSHMADPLNLASAHAVDELMAGWRGLARAGGWHVSEVVGRAHRFEMFWTAGRPGPVFGYLSAGIHGDEPAAAWGLLRWAQRNAGRAILGNLLIAPCLNPEGLRTNLRCAPSGLDLNRCFDRTGMPWVRQWRRLLALAKPSRAVLLHEDYDAGGCYLYELVGKGASSVGRQLLTKAAGRLGVDARRRIDGQRATQGLMVRGPGLRLPHGQPEALALAEIGCSPNFTFETPSEAAFADRVRAHDRFADAALRISLG